MTVPVDYVSPNQCQLGLDYHDVYVYTLLKQQYIFLAQKAQLEAKICAHCQL